MRCRPNQSMKPTAPSQGPRVFNEALHAQTDTHREARAHTEASPDTCTAPVTPTVGLPNANCVTPIAKNQPRNQKSQTIVFSSVFFCF